MGPPIRTSPCAIVFARSQIRRNFWITIPIDFRGPPSRIPQIYFIFGSKITDETHARKSPHPRKRPEISGQSRGMRRNSL